MSNRVYIEETFCPDPDVRDMFASRGYEIVDSPELCDILVFTGGEDVSPYLYGQENIASSCNESRDDHEVSLYEQYVFSKRMVGICRGGQFLHVMNGGELVQDIKPRHSGLRSVRSTMYDAEVDLMEDHHQAMTKPIGNHEILLLDGEDSTIEAIFYPETEALCFQAHPEWHKGTENVFFGLIETLKGTIVS